MKHSLGEPVSLTSAVTLMISLTFPVSGENVNAGFEHVAVHSRLAVSRNCIPPPSAAMVSCPTSTPTNG